MNGNGFTLKNYLWLEFSMLFLALPLVYIYFFPGLPLFLVLGVAVPVVGLLLYLVNDFNRRVMISWDARPLKRIFLRFFLVASAIALTVWLVLPDKFLSLPMEDPELMLLILAFYPVFSALPQELLFRTLYFERYGHLFGNKYVSVFINSALFGIAHLLFGNWLAVLASFVLSLFLGFSYLKYRSLLLCLIEHSLYGNFIFFIGIGEYFYKAPL